MGTNPSEARYKNGHYNSGHYEKAETAMRNLNDFLKSFPEKDIFAE